MFEVLRKTVFSPNGRVLVSQYLLRIVANGELASIGNGYDKRSFLSYKHFNFDNISYKTRWRTIKLKELVKTYPGLKKSVRNRSYTHPLAGTYICSLYTMASPHRRAYGPQPLHPNVFLQPGDQFGRCAVSYHRSPLHSTVRTVPRCQSLWLLLVITDSLDDKGTVTDLH